MLTIDANIQMIAEQELARSCREFHAVRGEVVVMDPQTGEVLALANYPTFNPQNHDAAQRPADESRAWSRPTSRARRSSRSSSGPALAAGVTTVDEVWPIPGTVYRTPYGRQVKDVHVYGPLATWDVLVKSSNIGMSMLGERMGNPLLHRALSGWGFGRRTGIELPGEDPGRLRPLDKWNKYSTESVSQGYEIMVTPLQLCRAFCAYANGGHLVTPTIVQGTLDAEGKLVPRNKPVDLERTPQVLDPRTAVEVRRVLCDVVVRGTATHARSDTWNMFGKTGTAHVSEGALRLQHRAVHQQLPVRRPAESPRLVVAFIIHEPDKKWATEHHLSHYGGAVAAPGAMRMMERSLAYLGVPPSPELPPPPPEVAKKLDHFDPKVYKVKPAKEVAEAR